MKERKATSEIAAHKVGDVEHRVCEQHGVGRHRCASAGIDYAIKPPRSVFEWVCLECEEAEIKKQHEAELKTCRECGTSSPRGREHAATCATNQRRLKSVALGIALDEFRVTEQKLRELRDRALRHDDAVKNCAKYIPAPGFERPTDEQIEEAAEKVGEAFAALIRCAWIEREE